MQVFRALLLAVLSLCQVHAFACGDTDSDSNQDDGIEYTVSAQATATDGRNTPLWLNANKHGLSSLSNANGYLRAFIERPADVEGGRRWDVGYGLDIAATFHYTSSVVVQQAFVEAKWKKARLCVGSREEGMELKNPLLSSGSQTMGINARPVPSVRLSVDDYCSLPFSKGWIGVKGFFSYGMTTDDRWQRDFTTMASRYTQNTFVHTKAGYVRIGNDQSSFPLSLEVGLEMGAQFGGETYKRSNSGTMEKIVHNSGFKAFWDAFFPGGADVTESDYKNVQGNELGSWVLRLNYDTETWNFGLYGDHYFEDHSSMFFLDYDGYGTGAEWDKRKRHRYILYDLRDIMLGAELKLKNATYINDIVFEYLYSKYQSGPIYHDHTQTMPDHIGGIDNYYNHHLYTGWQHWGQVMGNPLYLSPIYNDDGLIEVECNRMLAFHFGISGQPTDRLSYRLLGSWQKGYGTYLNPYPDPRECFSLMAEASCRLGDGWTLVTAAGMDRGQLRGNNMGLQITVSKTGLLTKKRNK